MVALHFCPVIYELNTLLFLGEWAIAAADVEALS
jgi:hypothetical protein